LPSFENLASLKTFKRNKMSKVLIIGAGGVGSVVAHKCALNSNVFTEILLASRTKAKCDKIAAEIKEMHGVTIETAQVDADIVAETVLADQTFPTQNAYQCSASLPGSYAHGSLPGDRHTLPRYCQLRAKRRRKI
jgi:shikimate 5-dehydrogenase